MIDLQRERIGEVAMLLYTCLGLEPQRIWKELTCKRPPVGEGPMKEIKSLEDLQRSLDYILETYGGQVEPDQAKGVGYYVLVEELCCGHPIFTIGTVAVLLMAGAKIYVEYGEREDDWFEKDVFSYQRFLNKLVDLSPDVEWVEDVDLYQRKRDFPIFLEAHPDIKHYVQVGDCANAHTNHALAAKCGLALHHPGAHVIVVEYLERGVCDEWSEADDALWAFGDQCWAGLIDYEAYHGDANRAEEIYAGFDFCDLFWGFGAVVNSWTSHLVPKDKMTVTYFTDQEVEAVKLPAHTEDCFCVIFGQDLDVRYPQYDFMQLLGVKP